MAWKVNLQMILMLMLLNVAVDGGASTKRDVMTRDAKQALTAAKAGIDLGHAISEFIEKKNFVSALANLTKSMGPYLGAIGPFVGFILALVPGQESAELKYMKTMMQNIDNRFDRLDSRFNDIERKIDWDTYKIRLATIEGNILSLSDKFKSFRQSTSRAVSNDRRNIFVSHYENVYGDSGLKLFNILTQRGVFREDLGDAVMKATEYDRRSTQEFLLGTLKLLLQAVKLELAYYHMKHPLSEHQQVSTWTGRMNTVRSTLSHIDSAVASKFNDQAGRELDDYLTKYLHRSNKDFATGFYNFLAHKYYWRDWIVFAYDPITGSDKHTISVCGHLKFRTGGRNAAFASVDKTHPRLNVAATKLKLDHTSQFHMSNVRPHPIRYTAEEIFKKLDKTHACATAVVEKNHGLELHYATARLAFSTGGKYYNILQWG